MATLSSSFRAESEINHREHLVLMEQLGKLDQALEELVCYSEVFANLAPAEQIYRCGRELSHSLFQHFAHEEKSVLLPVAALGPDMSAFAEQMSEQHEVLAAQFDSFRALLERLEGADDLEQCIWALKEQGRQFTRQLASHMGAEERRLATLQA